MRLTLLGTGNAMVTECYNTCFVLSDGERHLLVDGGGGNGIFAQLKRARIAVSSIHDIIVTHKHVDHILGVVWLMRLIGQKMLRDQYQGDVNIYAHDEVIGLLREMAHFLLQSKVVKLLDDRLHLITVSAGEQREIIGHSLTFFDIHSTKAKQYGFCLQLDETRRLTCCGDEPYSEGAALYAPHSAWLLHEAFCLHGQADIYHPYEKHHSTVKDACELAERLQVENLVLYHTEDDNIAQREKLYRAEGEKYYRGTLYIPNDLDVLEL